MHTPARPTASVLCSALVAAGLAVVGGCAAEAPVKEGVIARDVFIDTYVDLRTTALRAPEAELTDEARAEVLTRHGVTEEDLLAFADAWGGDIEYMRDVWDEVEARLDATRLDPGEEGHS